MCLIGIFSCQALCEVYSARESDIAFMENPGPVFQGFMDAGEILFQRPYSGILEYCSGVQHRTWWINVFIFKISYYKMQRGTHKKKRFYILLIL